VARAALQKQSYPPLQCMVVRKGLEVGISFSFVRRWWEVGTSSSDSQGRQTADYNLHPTQQHPSSARNHPRLGHPNGSKIRPVRNTTSRDRDHSHSPKLFLALQRQDSHHRLVRMQQHPSHPRRSAAMLHRRFAMRPGLDMLEGQQVLRRRLHGWDLWGCCLSDFLQ
jgi:hypothetical protein